MNIEKYLSDKGVDFELRMHTPAYTALEVAEEEHVSGDQFAKSVIIHSNKGYMLCVIPATFNLDMSKVATVLGGNAENIRLANETELAELFPDVEVGAEPPFGNLYNLPTILDTNLANMQEIVFQAGTHDQAIRMSYLSYVALVDPIVGDLSNHI